MPRWPLLLLLSIAACGVALGDDPPRRRGGPPPRDAALADANQPTRLAVAELEQFLPFRPAGVDQGPVGEAEAEELLTFARERMPRLAEVLERVRERNPRTFRERLAESAPRLRHLARIYRESVPLGDLVRRNAELHREAAQSLRRLRELPTDDPRRAEMLSALRERVRERFTAEAEIGEAAAKLLLDTRAARIRRRIDLLTHPDVDTARLPSYVAEAVRTWRSAGPDLRARIEAEMGEKIGTQLEREAAEHTRRAAERRARLEQDTDDRVRELLAGREGDPRRDGERRRDGGRAEPATAPAGDGGE